MFKVNNKDTMTFLYFDFLDMECDIICALHYSISTVLDPDRTYKRK